MIKKNIRAIAVSMAIILPAVGLGVGYNVKSDAKPVSIESYANGNTSLTFDNNINEVVYAFASANGQVNNVTVSSDKQFVTSQKALPVNVKVTYTLDGKEISPAELAGKSGKLVISYKYENTLSSKVTINDKEETIYTPFVALTGLILSNDSFDNININNGKLIDDGDHTIVVGFALPGMQESLGLDGEKLELPSSFEITADVTNCQIGNAYTLVTNEVFNDIDLDESMSLDGLSESLDSLKDAMTQLMDGSSSLYEGLSTLLEKCDTLGAGIDKLSDGANRIDSGVTDLKAGADKLNAGASDLYKGADQLSTGASTLKNGLVSADKGSDALKTGISDLVKGADTLNTGMAQVDAGAATLKEGLTSANAGATTLKEGLAQLTDKNNELNAGAGQVFNTMLDTVYVQLTGQGLQLPKLTIDNYSTVLSGVITNLKGMVTDETAPVLSPKIAAIEGAKAQLDSYNQFYQGLAAYTQGVKEASTGANNLAAGTSQLVAGATTLKEGTSQLATGTKELANGTDQLVAGSNDLSAGLKQLVAGSNTLSTGTNDLKNGVSSLKTGTNELEAGVTTLKTGTSELAKGAKELKNNVPTLIDGVTKLKDGSLQLKDGLTKLNEEGIEKFISVFEDDAASLKDRAVAILDASKNYRNYTSSASGQGKSVKFIYKLDGVELDK